MKLIKLLLSNFFIILISIFLIEIMFGYWFDKNNLGPYMREHRMKKNNYSLKYNNQIYNFTYKRNYFGFRGDEIDLKDIKAVIVGGSTTDERYKPEEFTITGYLNKKIYEKNLDIKIINAGIEGQSTLGHLYNFKVWFSKLKDFKPDFIIFYVGINDHYVPDNQIEAKSLADGAVQNSSNYEIIKDNFKSRSIFYDLIRKIKHKYYIRDKVRLTYDFDHSIKKFSNKNKFDFLTYKDAVDSYDIKKINKKNEKLINYYLNNIDQLKVETNKLGAKAIFINQLTATGYNSEKMFAVNLSLIQHCKIKNYYCIDLGKKLIGKKDYWWDGVHTTSKGSQAIADLIFPELYQIIKNN